MKQPQENYIKLSETDTPPKNLVASSLGGDNNLIDVYEGKNPKRLAGFRLEKRLRSDLGDNYTKEEAHNYLKEAVNQNQKTQELNKPIKPAKKLFNKLKSILRRYLDTSERNLNLLAIWILGTYFHSQFETYPLLLINARKQSGKTRLLKISSALSSGGDGSISTSITETHLFRHTKGAVFFDEMESVSSKEKTALRETINAVYKKGNKIVRYTEKRTPEGKKYVEECFYPYYPLGLANINGFGDVLEDRSLQIILQRSQKSQTKLVEDFSTNPLILQLKDELSRLIAEIPQKLFFEWNNFVENKPCDAELVRLFQAIKETNLYGRPLEIFLPLFVVADKFDCLEELTLNASEYISSLEGDATDNVDDLLQDFIIKQKYEGFVNLSDILKHFKLCIENPEDWVNAKWLGRALKRLGFVAKKRYVNGKSQILLNNNSTNTTNSINPINSTNSTTDNKVDLVELVELKDLVDKKEEFNPQEVQDD